MSIAILLTTGVGLLLILAVDRFTDITFRPDDPYKGISCKFCCDSGSFAYYLGPEDYGTIACDLCEEGERFRRRLDPEGTWYVPSESGEIRLRLIEKYSVLF